MGECFAKIPDVTVAELDPKIRATFQMNPWLSDLFFVANRLIKKNSDDFLFNKTTRRIFYFSSVLCKFSSLSLERTRSDDQLGF